jgi:putative membrane protein
MTGKTKLKLIIALILLAVALAFVLQNQQIVTVKFLVWSVKTQVSALFFGLFLLGLAVGWLVSWMARRKRGA